MQRKFKYIVWGGLIGIGHSIVTFILAVYFGLGMSRSGTWFWENFLAQPGLYISDNLERLGSTHADYYMFICNIIFYWVISAVLLHIISHKKSINQT